MLLQGVKRGVCYLLYETVASAVVVMVELLGTLWVWPLGQSLLQS